MKADVKCFDPKDVLLIVGVSEPSEELSAVCSSTRDRVKEVLAKDPGNADRALRYGAFSYLLEFVRRWPSDREVAVLVAEQFLSLNGFGNLMDSEHMILSNREVLSGFAGRILEGGYDWESFLIAFLDPEAVVKDRLRENLALTPTERYRRHQNFMRQVRSVRHAKL